MLSLHLKSLTACSWTRLLAQNVFFCIYNFLNRLKKPFRVAMNEDFNPQAVFFHSMTKVKKNTLSEKVCSKA